MKVHIYTTLAFLTLLGAPYIHDNSSLRVNLVPEDTKCSLLGLLDPEDEDKTILLHVCQALVFDTP